MMEAAPPLVHWATYVQTVMVVLSTIGTFVYVYFTYHIMKWAVGQGKASMDVAQLALREDRERRTRVLRVWARKLKTVQDRLLLWWDEYRRVPPNTFASVSTVARERIQAMRVVLRDVIAEAPDQQEAQTWNWDLIFSTIESACEAAGRAEDDEAREDAQGKAIKYADKVFDEIEAVQQKAIVELIGWNPFTNDPEEFAKSMMGAIARSRHAAKSLGLELPDL
jgi:hypothetical protein